MPNLVYTGKLPQNVLWQNEPSIPTPGNPDSSLFYPLGTLGQKRSYGPYNSQIIWDGVVPSTFNGITIAQLANLGINFNIKIDYDYIITSGTQEFTCTNTPTINLAVFSTNNANNNTILSFYTNMVSSIIGNQCNYCTSGACISCTGNLPYVDPTNPNNTPSFKFTEDFNTTIGNINLSETFLTVQVNPWNNGICDNQPVTGFGMIVNANITLSLSCNTPTELESGFCLEFCTELSNQVACYPTYREYCLSGANENLTIFGSTGCYQFFQDYIKDTGPNSEIDTLLTGACSQKISGLEAFNSETETVQNICACHLNPQFYNNIRTSLNNQIPGSKLIAEPAPCLFTPCVDSNFKSDVTGKICPLPACVNVASITNNGTVSGNNTITQSANCADISAPGSANNPSGGGGGNTTTKTWWEQHWLWVILGIGLLIVLIIVILVIIAAEGDKKKPLAKK